MNSFSAESIFVLLSQLDKRKSCGTTNVHSFVLQSCAESFAKSLELIFISCIQCGKLPSARNEAYGTPVFKKGRKTITYNYRQIFLLTASSKVMERIIRQIMTEHLLKYNLITKEQHGFVLKKSCLTNLLETIDVTSDA